VPTAAAAPLLASIHATLVVWGEGIVVLMMGVVRHVDADAAAAAGIAAECVGAVMCAVLHAFHALMAL